MKILDKSLLQQISSQAQENPRLRQNYNLHDNLSDPSQRLLIAMEPGSYVRPHRHLVHPKPEGFVAVQGRLALFTFDDGGGFGQIVLLGPQEPVFGVDLPVGVWHTIVSLETGSIFYETKPGPFQPIDPLDLAPWAPEEGSWMVGDYLAQLKDRVVATYEIL